jgi:succinate dehydrogenase/fumarate reductase cytochrome b subunit
VGGATGLLAPPLMWVLYGVYLFFSAAEPIKAFSWTLAYAYWMLVQVSAFTVLLGALVGAVLGYIQQVNARLPVKRSSSR